MPKIAVLLATYNGEKFLREQLDSIFSQDFKDFIVIARDDCSKDKSVDILSEYNVEIVPTENNLGAKGSFGSLLGYAVQNTDCRYFMFSDQDDVWKSDKISETMRIMQEAEGGDADVPVLVHTDLEVVDGDLHVMDGSFWHYEGLDPYKNRFNRLIFQNTVTGCTAMVNRSLAQLALPFHQQAILHDHWLALVASCFGRIAFSARATMLYRQHGSNHTGAGRVSASSILHNAYLALTTDQVYQKRLKKYIDQASGFLDTYHGRLSDDQISELGELARIRQKNFFARRVFLFRHSFFKQGLAKNIGMLVGI